MAGKAVGEEVHAWCALHRVNASFSACIAKYGVDNAGCLARAWCSKMHHFYNLGLRKAPGETAWLPEDRCSWQEPADFSALGTASGTNVDVRRRVLGIRRMFS